MVKTIFNVALPEQHQLFRTGRIHLETLEASRLPKFYDLYRIDERKSDNQSEHGRVSGLKSIYGIAGQVCQHFGWTLNYLLWEIDWYVVQRMLIDAPSYDSEEKKKDKVFNLTEQTAEDIEKLISKYNG